MLKFNWETIGEIYSEINIGLLKFICVQEKEIKEGKHQYLISLSIPNYNPSKLITIAKIKGGMYDALLKTEAIIEELKESFKKEFCK
jgi:hypothetical protein